MKTHFNKYNENIILAALCVKVCLNSGGIKHKLGQISIKKNKVDFSTG